MLGEGAGAVILRPLADALARGDRIYGVIKGSGASTGSGTVGFTAPNPQAQAEATRRALRASGVDPRTVTYVEAHGTGTSLGDPIEVRGLTLAYQAPELQHPEISGEQHCAIGSIKPNIGHLEAGAGVVSLIKVLLQLQHQQLLPSVTSAELNPQIPFGRIPFDVQRTLTAWERPVFTSDGRTVTFPRRAGLNSFGVGGSNVHLIVEEAPRVAAGRVRATGEPRVLTLSARSAESLEARARALQALVSAKAAEDSGAPGGTMLDEVCAASSVGRKHFEHRAAIVASSTSQLADLLEQVANGSESNAIAAGTVGRSRPAPVIAFLFTGQGSQYAGMGKALLRPAAGLPRGARRVRGNLRHAARSAAARAALRRTGQPGGRAAEPDRLHAAGALRLRVRAREALGVLGDSARRRDGAQRRRDRRDVRRGRHDAG